MSNDPGIGGDWDARKEHCGCGYEAVWKVTPVDGWDKITVVEQPGSKCCGCVPNLIRKTHEMTRVGNSDEWKGSLGFKPVTLKKTSEKELAHMTTDGPMVMTRS